MSLYRFLVVVLLFSSTAHAQFRASVEGTVLDVTGASVPGATVTLLNPETGGQQQARSNRSGFYVFNALAPGLYTVTAERSGFKKLTLENIRVEAEDVRALNLALETGDITQSITVTEQADPGIQTANANISTAFSSAQIRSLPRLTVIRTHLSGWPPGWSVMGAGRALGTPSGFQIRVAQVVPTPRSSRPKCKCLYPRTGSAFLRTTINSMASA